MYQIKCVDVRLTISNECNVTAPGLAGLEDDDKVVSYLEC